MSSQDQLSYVLAAQRGFAVSEKWRSPRERAEERERQRGEHPRVHLNQLPYRRPRLLLAIDTEASTHLTQRRMREFRGAPMWSGTAQTFLFGSALLARCRLDDPYASLESRMPDSINNPVGQFDSAAFQRWLEHEAALRASDFTPIEEWLIYHEQLPDTAVDTLRHSIATDQRTQCRECGNVHAWPTRLIDRLAFNNQVLYPLAYEAQALAVFFNAPFDLGRLAVRSGIATGKRFGGGHSLTLFTRRDDASGRWTLDEDRDKPRIRVKSIDSKRALIAFGQPAPLTRQTGSAQGQTPPVRRNRPYVAGHFLDCRQLAFALTDRAYSLRDAADAFETLHRKQDMPEQGVITSRYVGYARRDALVTQELAGRLLAEWDRHPISPAIADEEGLSDIPEIYLASPASQTKGYLRAMGLTHPLERWPELVEPKHRWALDAAMEAYFGGRSECRIRLQSVPVNYLDFASLYPTLYVVLELHRLLAARDLEVRRCTDRARRLLARLAHAPDHGLAQLQRPAVQRALRFFALTRPANDFLPLRTRFTDQYGAVAPSYGLAHCYVTDNEASWYTGLDLAASVLRTGKVPAIEDAVEFVPHGTLNGLHPVSIRGDERARVDPAHDDLAKKLVELRRSVAAADPQLAQALKIVANSIYGVSIEVDADTRATLATVVQHRWDGVRRYRARAVEEPGSYFFAPVGALLTGGAHLWMAILETLLANKQTVWVACDTDGALVPFTARGGRLQVLNVDSDGEPLAPTDIRALSSRDIAEIVAWFDKLNPYDRDLVPHLLESKNAQKIADANRQWGLNIREDAPLYAVAVAAKRYLLTTIQHEVVDLVAGDEAVPDLAARDDVDASGSSITTVFSTEHGLGHLLAPLPTGDELRHRAWKRDLWQLTLQRLRGESPRYPRWARLPAMMRVTNTHGDIDKQLNGDATAMYDERVKPHNFLLRPILDERALSDHYAQHPRAWRGHRREDFALVASFEPDPDRWTQLWYSCTHCGKRYRIATSFDAQSAPLIDDSTLPALAYRDVINDYGVHPERKALGPDGLAVSRRTQGVLRPRRVHVVGHLAVGKETTRANEQRTPDNRDILEATADAQTWTDVSHTTFATRVRPMLSLPDFSTLVAVETGVTSREIGRWQQGTVEPSLRTRQRVEALAVHYAAEALVAAGDDAQLAVLITKTPQLVRALSAEARVEVLSRFLAASAMRACPVCGKPIAGRPNKRYCSPQCSAAARQRQHRLRQRGEAR